MAAVMAMCVLCDTHAAVTTRGGGSGRVAVSRASAGRTPVATTATTANTTTQTSDASASNSEPETSNDPEFVIADRSSQFAETMAATGSSDTGTDDLAARMRAQMAALDAADAISAAGAATGAGKDTCHMDIHKCMTEKCGDDFQKCAGDGDTDWGDKIAACQRNTTCTGAQVSALSRELKADRDLNAKVAAYENVINCGTDYMNCLTTECGINMQKCLAKSAADAAMATCSKKYNQCTTRVDNGLASRAGEIFGNLRTNAEKQVKRDEERLYALRDSMRSQCDRLGAMFDERSLDCVFTVNLMSNNTIYASKKLYAGGTFNCDQNWFGIDMTTFKENAYRLTRSQESATSAFMGAGLGTAAGAITSGAMDRAIDRSKANRAVKKAEKAEKKAEKEEKKAEKEEKKAEKEDRQNENTKDQVMGTEKDGKDKGKDTNKDKDSTSDTPSAKKKAGEVKMESTAKTDSEKKAAERKNEFFNGESGAKADTSVRAVARVETKGNTNGTPDKLDLKR